MKTKVSPILLLLLISVVSGIAQQTENTHYTYTLSAWRSFRSEWKVYNTSNSILPSDVINALSFSPDSTIWIGTDSGLVHIVKDRWYLEPVPRGRTNKSKVTALATDSINHLWVIIDQRLHRWEAAKWVSLDSSFEGLNFSTGIYKAPFGRLWFMSENGLTLLDHGNWSYYNNQNTALPSTSIRTLFTDKQGRCWVGTRKGFVCYEDDEATAYNKPIGTVKSPGMICAAEDRKGNCWFGLYDQRTGEGCLAKFNAHGKWEYFDIRNSGLPSRHILDIVADPFDESIWLSISNLGLVRFDGEDWLLCTPESTSIPSRDIYDLMVDQDGTIWGASSKGLLRLRRKFPVIKAPLPELPPTKGNKPKKV